MVLFRRFINGWSFLVVMINKNKYKLTVTYGNHKFIYSSNTPVDLIHKAKLIIECISNDNNNSKNQFSLF